MTLKEFFRKARRSGKLWGLDRMKQVRCARGLCPLAAVTGIWRPELAAGVLGISTRSAWKIATAADYSGSDYRKWLLRNLGIKKIAP